MKFSTVTTRWHFISGIDEIQARPLLLNYGNKFVRKIQLPGNDTYTKGLEIYDTTKSEGYPGYDT